MLVHYSLMEQIQSPFSHLFICIDREGRIVWIPFVLTFTSRFIILYVTNGTSWATILTFSPQLILFLFIIFPRRRKHTRKRRWYCYRRRIHDANYRCRQAEVKRLLVSFCHPHSNIALRDSGGRFRWKCWTITYVRAVSKKIEQQETRTAYIDVHKCTTERMIVNRNVSTTCF